jgi:5'-3' exonuclease
MIIIDYSQIAISSLMAELRGHTDAEISTPLVRHMIINTIRSYKNKFGEEYGEIVIACDNKKYWRKKVFTHYKANRKKTRDTSGFNWSAIFEALNQIKIELAEFFPYPVIDVNMAEADDVIAALVEWTQTTNLVQEGLEMTPQPVLILSGDHDFTQLQRYKNVRQFSPVQKVWIKADGNIDEILMEHILSGDKGDGIPNFLSPDDVFVSGGRQKSIRKKDLEVWKTQSLSSHWMQSEHSINIHRNAQLIDLRNIPQDITESIVLSYTLQYNMKSKTQLLNYFMAHDMKHLMEHLTEF